MKSYRFLCMFALESNTYKYLLQINSIKMKSSTIIKTILYVSISCFMFLIMSSCEKEDGTTDPTDPIDPIDSCVNVVCFNNGYCKSGDCVCPIEYTGVDCGDQVTPKIVRIRKITVTKFPAKKSDGSNWDFLDGADIYVVLAKGNTTLWNASGHSITNANPNGDYNFNTTQGIALSEATSTYIMHLYDYDATSADDHIDFVLFTPYNSNNGFERTFTISRNGLEFRLEVDYEF